MRYRNTNARARILRRNRKAQSIMDWASGNWSGYALSANAGTFVSVSGQWKVPAVGPTSKNTYSSAWIGIDGLDNNDLIQTGTESDFVQGSAIYYAWWEILPAPETRIPLPVWPGNLMKAWIVKLREGRWRITIQNHTLGWSFTTIRFYHGPRSSAEFIQEAPTIDGRQSRLARYGSVTFNGCRVNGKNPRFHASESGVMIQNRLQVSTPSRPDNNADGFTVVYGARVPRLPARMSNHLALRQKATPCSGA